MKRNVFKGVNVTIQADALIERIVAVANYHELHLNGESRLGASELLGFIFEKIASDKDKDAALMDFLSSIKIKDVHGEPLKDNDLKRIVKEINDRR